MSAYNQFRFPKEPIPFDIAIKNAWLDGMSSDQYQNLETDYERARIELISHVAVGEQKTYTATAGAPCSSKSTILQRILYTSCDQAFKEAVLVDPDRYVMPFMNDYYFRSELALGLHGDQLALNMKEAYEYNRPGSNVIANTLLNEAVTEGYNIVHGTTSTSPHVEGLYKSLKAEDYRLQFILCFAPLQMRLDAGKNRIQVENHYQVTPEDFEEKGKMFVERMPVYFEYGSDIHFMWKPTLDSDPVHAASLSDGVLFVHDQDALIALNKEHNHQRESYDLRDTSQPLSALIQRTGVLHDNSLAEAAVAEAFEGLDQKVHWQLSL